MKKLIIYSKTIIVALFLLTGTKALAHYEMNISQITAAPYCPGESFTISFTIHFVFDPGNIYTAQMSNSSGSFANPVNIGTLAGTGAGTINCQIPYGTIAGTGYKFRLVSSAPAEVGDPAAASYTISTLPNAVLTANGPTTYCSGDSVSFSASTGSGYQYDWYRNNAIQGNMTGSSAVIKNAGKYKVVVTNAAGCSKISNKITTTLLTLPAATVTPSGNNTICSGTTLTMNAPAGTGYTYQWIKGATNINGAILSNYTTSVAGYYRVLVTAPNGCTRKSAKTQVSVINCLRESDDDMALGLQAVQMPFQSTLELNVATSSDRQSRIVVTDLQGQLIYEQHIKANKELINISINSETWANGMYLVNFYNADEVMSIKVVKSE